MSKPYVCPCITIVTGTTYGPVKVVHERCTVCGPALASWEEEGFMGESLTKQVRHQKLESAMLHIRDLLLDEGYIPHDLFGA